MTGSTTLQTSAAPEASIVDCTVIIVTYQSSRFLDNLLKNLQSSAEHLRLRIIVADNASTDDTSLIARSHGVELVQTGANIGYAGALNVAYQHALPTQPVLVLNPDLLIEHNTIAQLLDAADSDPRVGIAVPTILDDDGTISPSLRREPSILRALVDATLGRRAALVPGPCSEMIWTSDLDTRPRHPEWATGAAMLITPECSKRVGSWDEQRFFLYSEETDFFRRTRTSGLHAVYVPQATVQHSGAGSGSSALLVTLQAINRVQYYGKFHGRISTLIFHSIVVLHELLRSRSRSHRRALLALVRPRTWPTLLPPDGRRRHSS